MVRACAPRGRWHLGPWAGVKASLKATTPPHARTSYYGPVTGRGALRYFLCGVLCGVVVPFLGLVVGKTIETSRVPKGGGSRRGALWDHLLRFPVRL